MKYIGKSKILENKMISKEVFQIKIMRAAEMGEIIPGQFFNLKGSNLSYPLLRRPISVSGYGADYVEFTIKIVGEGTQFLSQLNVNDEVDLMGPLGNGFEISTMGKVLLVGGGIGIAPIKGLLQKADFSGEVYSILGYRDEPYLEKDFVNRSKATYIVSENDINCVKGYVTGPLLELLNKHTFDMVYACGPEGMLKAVAMVCNKHNQRAQLLMEEKMACGVGACLVCTCKVKDKDNTFRHVRMCKEGPMFYSDEVIFND